jgi:hypothetical protein
MKSKYFILPLLIIFSFTFISAFSGSGDGSSGNPFQITNCTQLTEIVYGYVYSYILVNDIDCSDTVNWNEGRGFIPINNFDGNLDGQGYTISNLFSSSFVRTSSGTIINNYIQSPGFFNQISGNTNISNLNLVNIKYYGRVSGSAALGGVANYMSTGPLNHRPRLENVTVSGFIVQKTSTPCSGSGNFCNSIGGLVGSGANAGVTTRYIKNSSFNGVIASYDGNMSVGGIVGKISSFPSFNSGVEVIDCYGNVDIYSSGSYGTGLVYGTGNDSLVTNSVLTGNIYDYSALPLQYTYPAIINSTTMLSSVYVKVGETFTQDYETINPNEISVTWSDNSPFFDINPTTGEISYTGKEEDLGTYSVTITLTDELSRTDTDDFTFTVYNTEAPVQTSGGGTPIEIYSVNQPAPIYSVLNFTTGTFSSINTAGISDWAKDNKKTLLIIGAILLIFIFAKKK